MDYEATDKFYSSFVVTCEHNGTRFFLTDNKFATDIKRRAQIFRRIDDAERAASWERDDVKTWRGAFDWRADMVAKFF